MYYKELMDRLNKYQRRAVEDDSPACVVNANVGSGKTTVLIAKILYLNLEKKVPVRNMAVLTFTNKAAGEIKERLLDAHPGLTEEDLAGFGTFHSVAMNYLRTRLDVESMGWTKGFMIIDPDEEMELILRIAKDRKLKIKYKNRLKKRMEQEYPAFLQGKKQSRYQDDLFVLFDALGEEKRRQDKMSFSDLIQVSTALLNSAGDGLEQGGIKPDWIIIDEVQDSDRQQIEFITALKAGDAKLFAVGDPNQLIYSWRGSVETMFYYLKNQFQAKELTLPVNYRSSAAILEAAGKFMQYGNTVEGNQDFGEKILIQNHYDAFQEAQYLVQRIRLLHEEGLKYGEIAIFYRLKSQSEILEKVFQKEGIPYTVSLKKTVKDIPVLDWFVKVLTYSCCPDDNYSAESVLSHPLYGEGMGVKKTKDFLTERRKGISVLYDRMSGFAESFSSKEMPEPEAVYEYFSLDSYLKPNLAAHEEDREMVLDFLKRLVRFGQENQKGFRDAAAQFLNSSALYGIQILKEDEDPGKDKVRLMTLHASKGLEFSYVFIIGVNQGLIPLAGKDFEEEEEERRLFFVGMTRAKERLELSYYTNPGQPRIREGPGRYLDMLPQHLLEWEGRQTQKQANLHKLRKEVRKEQEYKEQKHKEQKYKGQEYREQKYKEQEYREQEYREQEYKEQSEEKRKVRHPKYGTGVLISENELILEAEFENYGRKEFLKAFSEVELL